MFTSHWLELVECRSLLAVLPSCLDLLCRWRSRVAAESNMQHCTCCPLSHFWSDINNLIAACFWNARTT